MNDFKNQSPWGTPPGGNGNGDGGFRRGLHQTLMKLSKIYKTR